MRTNFIYYIILYCSIHKAFNFITNFFSVASYLGVVAVSVDRFLAIHFHLRYQELVTHKRVVAVVISIWMIRLVRLSRWWRCGLRLKFACFFRHWYFNWPLYHNTGLRQDLFHGTTPQESDSGCAFPALITEWRNVKFS